LLLKKNPYFRTEFLNHINYYQNAGFQFYIQDAMYHYEEYRILDKHHMAIAKASDKIYRTLFFVFIASKDMSAVQNRLILH